MTLTAKAGEPFAVRLSATPSAGYVWEVRRQPPQMEFLGSEVEPPSTSSQPGQGSAQVFRFRVAGAGEFEFEFYLKRPWEESAIQSQTVRINIV